MAVKLTLGNSKGGVGKTIITNLLAYHLAEQGNKVLVVDLDPQGNSTLINRIKYDFPTDIPSFIDGVAKKDLSSVVLQLEENLFLLPGDRGSVDFETYLPNKKNKKHVQFLATYMEELDAVYDYIFYDVPPTTYTIYLNNALCASDYFIILTEAALQSFTGIEDFYDAAVAIQKYFNPNLDCLGIIVNRRESDVANFDVLEQKFGISTDELFFKKMIPSRKRIGKYSEVGLYNFVKTSLGYDRWDNEVKSDIAELVEELQGRLGGVRNEAVKQ